MTTPLQKTPMPILDPEYRACVFDEVALGYTAEMAMDEASRCLHCKNAPCMQGCPVQVRIPDFLKLAAEGKFEEAYGVLSETSTLPAVCGRVCPQENQCEGRCVRGIKGESVGIGRVERFVADWHGSHRTERMAKPEPNGHKAAVIGSGPGGLTCAGDLARCGCDVTIFEALHEVGGVLVYGIPEFRLPKRIVKAEVDTLREMGVKIRTNVIVGKTVTLDELRAQGYESFFIASGAGLPQFMGIPGENLCGVYSANEYLTRINLMKAYQPESTTPVQHASHVAVVGGGNVAMDAARCALRMGAKNVTIVYRRSMQELPARAEEVKHAKEEGIDFEMLCNPVSIIGDEKGHVRAIRCVRMMLGEPDASGRRRPVEIAGSEFEQEVDMVIIAIGTAPNPLLRQAVQDLVCDRYGRIVVYDEFGQTSIDDVFAGGDAVTGSATVIQAMGAGKLAAQGMLKKMTNQ